MRNTLLLRPIACLGAALLVAGCLPEDDTQETTQAPSAPPPVLDVSRLAETRWPPAAESGAASVAAALPDTEMLARDNNVAILDMSGSMGESGCSGAYANRAEAAKAALKTWVLANGEDNIGLVSFSSAGLRRDVALGRGADQGAALAEAIDGLRAEGGTPLRSAMRAGLEDLEAQARRQGGLGTYRLVVITDGEASRGEDPTRLVEAIKTNPANPVEIHTIGFCLDDSHSLADPNGVFYTSAGSPEDLAAGLQATQSEATGFARDTTFSPTGDAGAASTESTP